MTNENLKITCNELLALKDEYPLEIEIIIEMLIEADEDHHLEMSQLAQPALQAAA